MQQALRPYIMTGIAVAGASVIAVTPVTLRPADVQTRAVALATTPTDIFTPYDDLFTNTLSNLQTISQGELANPFPVLDQIATNWEGYFSQVAADPQSITAIPGEIATHLQSVTTLLTTLLPEISAQFLPLPAQISVDLSAPDTLLVAALGPLVTTGDELSAVIGQIQTASDPTAALTALVDAPANLLNAFLNGKDSLDLLGMIYPPSMAFSFLGKPSTPV